MKRMPKKVDLEKLFEEVRPWAQRVAWVAYARLISVAGSRCWKKGVKGRDRRVCSLTVEDFGQEAQIVLWRAIEKYGSPLKYSPEKFPSVLYRLIYFHLIHYAINFADLVRVPYYIHYKRLKSKDTTNSPRSFPQYIHISPSTNDIIDESAVNAREVLEMDEEIDGEINSLIEHILKNDPVHSSPEWHRKLCMFQRLVSKKIKYTYDKGIQICINGREWERFGKKFEEVVRQRFSEYFGKDYFLTQE